MSAYLHAHVRAHTMPKTFQLLNFRDRVLTVAGALAMLESKLFTEPQRYQGLERRKKAGVHAASSESQGSLPRSSQLAAARVLPPPSGASHFPKAFLLTAWQALLLSSGI